MLFKSSITPLPTMRWLVTYSRQGVETLNMGTLRRAAKPFLIMKPF